MESADAMMCVALTGSVILRHREHLLFDAALCLP